MSLENVFPNKEQFDTMNTLLASIASNTGSSIKVKNFADVQQLTRLGLAKKVFGVAEQLVAEKETSVVASIGDSTGITAATVDAIKFITALGTAHEAIYVATYDGTVWHKENGENVSLVDFGITVTGTPVKDDKIVITVHTNSLAFDIVDFNKHTPRNGRFTNSIDLLLHDIATYGTIPFCAAQLLYRTDVELPAGNYKFTLDHARYGNGTEYDGTYMFTTTKPIPVDGGFRHTNIGGWKEKYVKADALGKYITTYGIRPERTEIETSLAVTEWDGTTECTDLGTFTAQKREFHTDDGKHNFTERNCYGSNRWRDSVYRQWLNSDAAPVASGSSTVSNWWKPQSVFDRVPGGAKNAGFLYGLDPDFVNSLGEVEIKTALHECDRAGSATYDITYDKVFLLSRKEVFGSDEYSAISEGSLLEYFNGATNADRIKYHNGAACWWWLRTPNSGIACSVRGVSTDGTLNVSCAGSAIGVVPACCII